MEVMALAIYAEQGGDYAICMRAQCEIGLRNWRFWGSLRFRVF